jgi:hypothetical protein
MIITFLKNESESIIFYIFDKILLFWNIFKWFRKFCFLDFFSVELRSFIFKDGTYTIIRLKVT